MDEEKSDKPDDLAVLSGTPEGDTFPDQGPEHDDNEEPCERPHQVEHLCVEWTIHRGRVYHQHMKYLGIDFGMRKVGVAFTDDAGRMGFPHSVIPNDGKLMNTVLALIQKEGAGAIVVGESMNYQGEENAVAKPARAFAEALAEKAGLPLHFMPEVLTTEEARRMPDGSRVSGGIVDASAAALILTHYIEAHDHA